MRNLTPLLTLVPAVGCHSCLNDTASPGAHSCLGRRICGVVGHEGSLRAPVLCSSAHTTGEPMPPGNVQGIVTLLLSRPTCRTTACGWAGRTPTPTPFVHACNPLQAVFAAPLHHSPPAARPHAAVQAAHPLQPP